MSHSSEGGQYLGPEITYSADEGGVVVHNASFGSGSFGFWGFGGAPSPTKVITSGSNLEFNLIWDSSVSSAPSWFQQAVINVAQYFESSFTAQHLEVINLHVGWGEVGGSSLPSGAIGASETNGYLTNWSTVTNGLIATDPQLSLAKSFSASNEPTGAQFFISSAEAKAFGLISGTSSGTDGYIGFGTLSFTGYSWNHSSSSTGDNTISTGGNTFDFQAVVQHEISEVMGRIEMEGQSINGQATYTPLDLLNFSAYNTLALSSASNSNTQVSSYFSTDDGATAQGYFNDGYKGGDIADWASYSSYTASHTNALGQDAYNAFAYPDSYFAAGSVSSDMSQADYNVDLSLGLVGITGSFVA